MSYPCPRCNAETRRSPKFAGGGLVGVLVMYVLAARECAQCGVIEQREFSPELRSQMLRGRIIGMAAVILGFVVVVGGITYVALAFDLME